MIGYNSSRFDCIVIAKQNARYGVEDTSFAYSLDVMTLPDIQGTLEEIGKQFGLTAATYHRALADVWLTAQIADHIAGMQGTSVLDRCIGVVAGGGPFSPRKEREAELLAFYEMNADLPDLTDFSERHGIKTSTAEGDVERLIAAGRMPRSLLENPEVQEWLAIELPNAIRECWIDDAEGRLKPLMQHLQDRAPDGLGSQTSHSMMR